MEWAFHGYTLNADRAELNGPDGPVHIERSPLNVLIYLIENADRVISKDELIETVWDGRIVSDTTISTAVKHARKAVGDNGTAQSVIRTVHGRGFRFVAQLDAPDPAVQSPSAQAMATPDASPPMPGHGAGKPGLAVLRFVQLGEESSNLQLSSALPAELISGLSRVQWLHVIARGSSFQFDPQNFDPVQVGTRLGVSYLMTGLIEVIGKMLTVTLELQSAANGSLVWSGRFASALAEIQIARGEMVAAVVSALELAIPNFEAEQSSRLSPDQLDAWSHFHVGLSHILKFNKDDNLIAARHFGAALDLDPHFARAHAGLSFTHWQNGFMFFRGDREDNQRLALEAATRAMDIEPSDPFVNFNMGRACWLEGDIAASHAWLDRAILLNPNYARCHYNKGLILAIDGRADEARGFSEKALSLSPLDPFAYGMYGVRALSALIQEDYSTAVDFGERAMRSPGAHVFIALIAALANQLHGNHTVARRWRDFALTRRPDLTIPMFFAAFPFSDPAFQQRITTVFKQIGIDD